MLLVGHYWRKSGGPPVWAHATGTYVRYCSGDGTQVTPLIQDIHTSKVYNDPPFSYMMGTRDFGEGMTPERKAERGRRGVGYQLRLPNDRTSDSYVELGEP
jgi:hypothetical protein